MKETIAQEALRLLESIKSTKFITHKFTNEIDCCCAIGHYTRLKSDNPDDYSGKNCNDRGTIIGSDIRVESKTFLNSMYPDLVNHGIAEVNNYPLKKYQQKTPKGRSIALLKDMIKAGY